MKRKDSNRSGRGKTNSASFQRKEKSMGSAKQVRSSARPSVSPRSGSADTGQKRSVRPSASTRTGGTGARQEHARPARPSVSPRSGSADTGQKRSVRPARPSASTRTGGTGARQEHARPARPSVSPRSGGTDTGQKRSVRLSASTRTGGTGARQEHARPARPSVSPRSGSADTGQKRSVRPARSSAPSRSGSTDTGQKRNVRPSKGIGVREEASSKGKRGKKVHYTEDSTLVRLNKFLADAGVCSRRKADELIREGVVKVNKEFVTEPGTQVHISDLVTVNGEPVNAEKHLTYILLNKPKGYITTTSDEKGRKTVMDLVRARARIFPVGRLDRNTTGVLLFTNDGEMANRLMHPSYQVSRVYNATLNKALLMDHARKIANGIELEDGMTQPCSIVIDPQKKDKVMLEITEGKNREVRRIFEALGYEVEKLDRKMYANMTTRGMKRGEFRHLTRQEVQELQEILGLERRTTSTGQAGIRRRPSGIRRAKKST